MVRFYLALAVIASMAAGASASDGAEMGRMQASAAPSGSTSGSTSGPTSGSAADAYRLGSGDRLRVTVYGESDLSGTFEVTGTGKIAYPLIGEVDAGGKTLRELEAEIERKLLDGYLRKPRVNAEVTNYRPFYIIGEVQRPGSYPYVEGMTVVNAVALGGGYTYRAREDRFLVRRVGDPKENEVEAKPDELVRPGDVVRVPERFF